MTNKERFLARQEFIFIDERYAFAINEGGNFLRRRNWNGDYEYFSNVKRIDEKSFTLRMVFFGAVMEVITDFDALKFVDQEGGAQQ